MNDTKRVFEAPGGGAWELETAHFTRPMTTFAQEAVAGGFPEGFAEGMARYGMLLSHFEPRFVHGFMYQRAVAFGAPPDAKGPPPKLIFQALTRLHPAMRRRIRAGHEAMEKKVWRDDLRRWDDHVKPASIRRHRELSAIDVRAMSDEELCAHLEVCLAHVRAMIRQHHEFTATCILPVGDLLAHVQEWTGKSPGEILQVLRGSSQISLGVAREELEALAAAIREDAEAKAILDRGGAAALDGLTAHAGAVGEKARAYLELTGLRCLGYDIGSKSAIEMPDVLVRAIQSAVRGEGSGSKSDLEARIAKLREAVPAEHRARFDELLGEARFINRLRDERGHYSDGWASGIARRGVLEAGRRLVEKGLLPSAELAVDATCRELCDLLRGKPGPSAEEIQERVTWRTTKTASDPDIPAWLGAPPSPPPPAEWLPEKGRRGQRAVSAFIGTLFGEPAVQRTATSVKGLPVSPGVYEGTARLVGDESDFGLVQQGDVLVTRATSPYFNVVLPLLGAIVTDRGGQLCHAAIVSREYGIPGVVGTREATQLIPDGARVRVDGDAGTVVVLG